MRAGTLLHAKMKWNRFKREITAITELTLQINSSFPLPGASLHATSTRRQSTVCEQRRRTTPRQATPPPTSSTRQRRKTLSQPLGGREARVAEFPRS